MESWNYFISDDEYSISNGTNNDVDVYSMSNGTISDISMVPSVEETGEDSNEVRDGSSLQDGLGVPGEVLKENRNRFDRFDEIADIIINAFTIRKRERFINSEQGILSNEESEVRLIILGSVLGLILNVTLSAMLVLASIVFSNKFAVTTFTPSLEKSNSYPTPYLLIMSKLGLGDIVVLRQDKELNFEIDFNFKVPANKAHFSPHYFLWTSWPGYHGRAIETGYSVFEDRGDLFIVYSDTSKRMIVLNPSNKHKTLINSQLPTNHFYSNSIVRTGDFVWIFGGYSVPTSDPKSLNHSEFQNHGCSSVKYGAEEDTFTGSAMWHMDKQVWFEGPSLPIKTCSLESTAISLNKTDVLIFIGPFIGSYLKHVEGEEWINEKGGCIQALHFSYKTFSWVSQDDCFIDFGPRHYNYNGHIQNIKHFYNTSNILSLVSTSVLDKDGNMHIFLLAHEDYTNHKLYLVKYFSQSWKQLDAPYLESRCSFTLFAIRNQVFAMTFQQSKLVELFHVQGHNGNYTKLQEIQDFPLSIPHQEERAHSIISVPFYK